MKNSLLTGIITSAILAVAQPAFSQQQLQNHQPLTKVSTEIESRIQNKLQADYKQGLIDSTQLASMQRDFDGILTRENNFKSRGQADGMTSGGRNKIVDELEAFEARLDKQAGVSKPKSEM